MLELESKEIAFTQVIIIIQFISLLRSIHYMRICFNVYNSITSHPHVPDDVVVNIDLSGRTMIIMI